ncbi:MAG: TaqI-like C-terminal specificity domain-containing protein, partial [Candidatus Hodarchaeota archaeon]
HKIGKRINQYPNAQSYLKRFIANLDKLRGVKNNSRPLGKRYAVVTEKKTPYDVVRYNERIFGPWNYQKEKFDFPKEGVIFGRYRNKTACFALSDKDLCCLTNTIAISSKKLYGCSMRYLLALLNSQVADFYIHFGRKKKKGAVQEYRRSTLQDVPIRIPHLQNPDEKRIHDTIVAKTEILEDLQQRILHGRCQSEEFQKQYYQTKKELDQIFFQLYNLESLSERIAHHLAISA